MAFLVEYLKNRHRHTLATQTNTNIHKSPRRLNHRGLQFFLIRNAIIPVFYYLITLHNLYEYNFQEN